MYTWYKKNLNKENSISSVSWQDKTNHEYYFIIIITPIRR